MKKIFSLITAMALLLTMTPFQSSFAASADTIVKVSDKVWVGNQEAQHAALITLEEADKTLWSTDDVYEIRLQEGVTWSKYTRINGRLVKESDINGRDLTIKLNSTDKIDKLIIDPYINIDRKVEKGDLTATFSRGDVSNEHSRIVIAEVKDYGAKISVSKIENIKYGDIAAKEIIVTLEEFVEGSLLKQTEYELELLSAKIDTSKEFKVTKLEGNRKLTTENNSNIITFVADDNNGKGKWALKFNIIPEKDFDGDIIVKLQGREVEDSITVAIVEKELAVVNGTPTNIALGYQNQNIATIEISETAEGAVLEGVHAIIVEPEYKGLNFTDGKIEVTEGNVRIDNFSTKNGMIEFEVTKASTHPSKIVISGLKVTVDQFGYIGEYKGNIMLNYGKPSETKLGEVILFNATTSKPTEDVIKFAGQFSIGNPNFTITTNGISRTEIFDAAPYIEDGRAMLSVKAAGIALDAKISYDDQLKMVTVESGENKATMIIGSNILNVNGESIVMDTPATIKDSRAFIPLKYLADAFNAEVVWDDVTKTVTLMKN